METKEQLEEIKINLYKYYQSLHVTEEEKDFIFNELKIEWLIEQVEQGGNPGIELELLNEDIVRLEKQNKRYREAIDKTLHKCDLADDTGHDYTDEIRYELRKALEGESQ